MKRIPLPLLLFLAVFPFQTEQAFAWSDALVSAAEAMATNTASPEQQKLLVRENDLVNQMRQKGVISESAYQASQRHYSEKVQAFASDAARENGATLRVQERKANTPWDAGTDSDFITDAKTKKQVTEIQNSLNRKLQEYVGDQTQKNYLKKNDIDIMVDPAGVSPEEFKKIAAANNDAYKRPEAASYEAKSRSGQRPSVQETTAYLDEMRDFIEKKKGKSRQLSEKLREVNADPEAHKKGTEAYDKRMSMEAKLQQTQAQQAKYLERIQGATETLAQHAGSQAPDASALPGQGKVRGPSEQISVQQRQIKSATVDAANTHLVSQGKMNETLMLAELAQRDPAKAGEYKQRIAEVSKDLNPSQKGELVERLKNNTNLDSTLVRDLNNAMKDGSGQRNHSPTAGSVKTPALHRMGDATGVIGDLMGIQEKLGQAEQGSHLLINFSKDDSTLSKGLKMAGVAALELAPIPVLDSLEKGWTVDEKIKKEIVDAIRRGEHVDPALVTARVFAEIGVDTVADFTIKPVLQGVEATAEGGKMAKDMFQNWQDDTLRSQSQALQEEKFEAIVARIEQINLGPVRAERRTPAGEKLYSLDSVGNGDVLACSVERNAQWTDKYFVRWEVLDNSKQVLSRSQDTPATSPAANTFSYSNTLQPGSYQVVFRVFDRALNKQMDSSSTGFTVADALGIGAIQASLGGNPFSGKAKVGESIRMQVSPSGKWDAAHTIEWILDGDRPIKSEPASSPGISEFSLRMADYYNPGRHTVSVRAINNASGKIVAHQQLAFTLIDGSKTEEKKAEDKKPETAIASEEKEQHEARIETARTEPEAAEPEQPILSAEGEQAFNDALAGKDGWGDAPEEPEVVFEEVDTLAIQKAKAAINQDKANDQGQTRSQIAAEQQGYDQAQANREAAAQEMQAGLQSLATGLAAIQNQHQQQQMAMKQQQQANMRQQAQLQADIRNRTQQNRTTTTTNNGYPVLDPYAQRYNQQRQTQAAPQALGATPRQQAANSGWTGGYSTPVATTTASQPQTRTIRLAVDKNRFAECYRQGVIYGRPFCQTEPEYMEKLKAERRRAEKYDRTTCEGYDKELRTTANDAAFKRGFYGPYHGAWSYGKIAGENMPLLARKINEGLQSEGINMPDMRSVLSQLSENDKSMYQHMLRQKNIIVEYSFR